jgi:DNA-directed RNA polymerase specialized sigma24 family protein
MDDQSAQLLARWRDGDQRAADELFQRYAERLLSLARSRLSRQLARRIDPEDVVQSAYRSFFLRSRDGRYVLQRSGDLWKLLAAITLHKLQGQVEHHTAGKRALDRERPLTPADSLAGLPAEAVGREPSPAEVAAVIDELEQVLRGLSPLHRRMVELRLQGYLFTEIAAETQRSERMVRVVLDKVKGELEQRYRKHAGD